MNESPKTVLVVDDESDIRELLNIYFSEEGFNVLEAENGTKAFQIACSYTIHAIVSDVKMPGGDGVTLLKDVRKMNPKIPIMILVSGFADVSPEEAIKLGAIKMFPKPIHFESLIQAVKENI